ncbi:DUF4332 domain-containing protein [Kordia sp. YSTF-M3]|uniref:DUF4332 domain-containing protein n=1 Tax=Kordia aestuariivivens TaxID=2759037 RepID=A0ABR7Q6Y5_9FLAO|nr:DUF4332 domain-containing protein [Kordia aestuariivivens]MBC8754099.1 DUF4332 domain-containing protein [Kordia aestuariivivens]
MGYYIDLKSISIDAYKDILKTKTFIPSWKILENDIDKNLNILKAHQINNLDELLITLKDKSKIQEFSKQSGLPENYLAVLKRVVKGYRPKPNRIKDFTCISEDIVLKLEKTGIKNTLKLYDEILTDEIRSQLSRKAGISDNEIMKLTKLTDLSRIRWVNHTFAYVLLESGYDTAEKVAKADYQELYETIKQLNNERKIYNAHIGVNDMKMIIESAQSLGFEIEY